MPLAPSLSWLSSVSSVCSRICIFNPCLQFTGSACFFFPNVSGVCFLSGSAFMVMKDLIFSCSLQNPSYLHNSSQATELQSQWWTFPSASPRFLHTWAPPPTDCMASFPFLLSLNGTFSEKSSLINLSKSNPTYTYTLTITHSVSCCHSIFVNYVKNFKLYLKSIEKAVKSFKWGTPMSWSFCERCGRWR